MKVPKLPKLGRYALCVVLLVAVFLCYEVRLFQWQIVDGEEYERVSLSSRTDTIEVSAARGQILDRNGQVLAGNRTVYNVVYNALYMDYDQRNVTIMQVIDLLEERGEEWRDRLPIVIDDSGAYQFEEDQESAVAALKEFLGLAEYATAQNCMDELADTYDCRGYSSRDMRNILSVRYSMTQDGYSRTNPYVIAQDVSPETVGVISQRAEEWPGIETRVSAQRYYGEDGSLAPHVVGYVGTITEEQYDQAKEEGNLYDSEDNPSGYKYTDEYGRSGIEAAFEEELRGDRGEETIFTDETGAVKSTAVTRQPKEGSNVQLTLDSDLQRVANLSLEKNIQGNTDARNCTSGAAVVLDVDTFGVLACSSYPTYDVNQLVESIAGDGEYYNTLLADENQPMVNLALNGVFAGLCVQAGGGPGGPAGRGHQRGHHLHLRRRVELFRPEPGLPVRRRHPRPVRGHRPILQHLLQQRGLKPGHCQACALCRVLRPGHHHRRGDWRIHGHHVQPPGVPGKPRCGVDRRRIRPDGHRPGGQHVHPHPAGHHVRHHGERRRAAADPPAGPDHRL